MCKLVCVRALVSFANDLNVSFVLISQTVYANIALNVRTPPKLSQLNCMLPACGDTDGGVNVRARVPVHCYGHDMYVVAYNGKEPPELKPYAHQ